MVLVIFIETGRPHCVASDVIVGERASGESSHLFHQDQAQQGRQCWDRWPPGGAVRGADDTCSSGVWSGPGQTQGEDERSQRGLQSDSLQPAVLRRHLRSDDCRQRRTQLSHVFPAGLHFSCFILCHNSICCTNKRKGHSCEPYVSSTTWSSSSLSYDEGFGIYCA